MIALMPGGVRGQVKIQMESIQKWISIYRMILIRFFITFGLILTMLPSFGLYAQDRNVPYWVSISSSEVRMRVGPSTDFPIDWVYRRKGLPLKVIRIQEGWRLVQDPEGTQGWMFNSLLSLERTALVIGSVNAEIRADPSDASRLNWTAEPGVIGKLGACQAEWCEFDVDGRRGWVHQNRLWGVGTP